MAHQLSYNTLTGRHEMAYAGDTPWHALGTRVDGLQTAAAMLSAAGLDWHVELVPLYVDARRGPAEHVDTPPTRQTVPAYYATRRVDSGAILGVVSDRYRVIQNREAGDVLDALVIDGGAHVEVAGALGQGERAWMLAHVPADFEVARGDTVKTYVLLAWGHDGKHGLAAKLTPVRVVCANTLSMALGDKWSKTADVYIRHSGDAKVNLEQAQRALGLVKRQAETTAAAYQLLAATRLADPRSYFAEVWPAPERPADHLLGSDYDEKLAKWDAHQREVLHLYEGRGAGAALPGVAGTVWGGYNAATEWVDHVYPVLQSGRVSTVRQQSVLFGAYADTKSRALAVGLELAGAGSAAGGAA
jgi:phage/plasmid-like protein (TIGR03299 family)